METYLESKSANTIRTHSDGIKRFAEYLTLVDPSMASNFRRFAEDMLNWSNNGTVPDITLWNNVTHELVRGFRDWLVKQGDAIGTINCRLSTLRSISKIAFLNGAITEFQYVPIERVRGYSRKEGKSIDSGRQTPRRGTKKAEHTAISEKQAGQLKAHPDTPQGRRDRLMMCLLLDHGLRAGEVCGLTVGNINLTDKKMTFYREKVDKVQTHDLSHDTYEALHAYFMAGDAPLANDAPLLRSSKKDGELTGAGISTRSLTKRVKHLGEEIGIDMLSAHDCRHYWASRLAMSVDGTAFFTFMEAGGWNSPSGAIMYVHLFDKSKSSVA